MDNNIDPQTGQELGWEVENHLDDIATLTAQRDADTASALAAYQASQQPQS